MGELSHVKKTIRLTSEPYSGDWTGRLTVTCDVAESVPAAEDSSP
jgi:hypothetical protein